MLGDCFMPYWSTCSSLDKLKNLFGDKYSYVLNSDDKFDNEDLEGVMSNRKNTSKHMFC